MTSDLPAASDASPRILVTGAPRSGTTWVGRTLCLGGDVGEIYEPFNPRSTEWRWFDPPESYLYLDESLEAPYVDAVTAMSQWRYPLAQRLRAGDGRRALRAWSIAREHRRAARGVLIKDPLAIMSAPWLVRRFGYQPLFLVRHPAGFVSSLLRVGWHVRFGSWLRQPQLLDSLLAPWREEIEQAHRDELDIVAAGALFWRVCAGVVTGYRAEHPSWLVVRHEDVAADAVTAYRDLYGRLGLTWSDGVAQTIRRENAADNPREVVGTVQHGLQRDSKSVATIWHDRLTEQHVETVRRVVGDIAEEFYDDATWSSG